MWKKKKTTNPPNRNMSARKTVNAVQPQSANPQLGECSRLTPRLQPHGRRPDRPPQTCTSEPPFPSWNFPVAAAARPSAGSRCCRRTRGAGRGGRSSALSRRGHRKPPTAGPRRTPARGALPAAATSRWSGRAAEPGRAGAGRCRRPAPRLTCPRGARPARRLRAPGKAAAAPDAALPRSSRAGHGAAERSTRAAPRPSPAPGSSLSPRSPAHPVLPAVGGPHRSGLRAGTAAGGESAAPRRAGSAVLAQAPGTARPSPGGAGRSSAHLRDPAPLCPLPAAPQPPLPPRAQPPRSRAAVPTWAVGAARPGGQGPPARHLGCGAALSALPSGVSAALVAAPSGKSAGPLGSLRPSGAVLTCL